MQATDWKNPHTRIQKSYVTTESINQIPERTIGYWHENHKCFFFDIESKIIFFYVAMPMSRFCSYEDTDSDELLELLDLPFRRVWNA